MALIHFTDYRQIPAGQWHWPNISPKEASCSHCGAVRVDTDAMYMVQAARILYGRPIVFACIYRCPLHPIEVAKPRGPGTHSRGVAFDPYPAKGGDLTEMLLAFWQLKPLGRGFGLRDGRMHIHFDWDKTLGQRTWGY